MHIFESVVKSHHDGSHHIVEITASASHTACRSMVLLLKESGLVMVTQPTLVGGRAALKWRNRYNLEAAEAIANLRSV